MGDPFARLELISDGALFLTRPGQKKSSLRHQVRHYLCCYFLHARPKNGERLTVFLIVIHFAPPGRCDDIFRGAHGPLLWNRVPRSLLSLRPEMTLRTN